MFIKKKVYRELVNENDRLKNEIEYLYGKRKAVDGFCTGCKYLIRYQFDIDGRAKTGYKCKKDRVCKDYENKGD